MYLTLVPWSGCVVPHAIDCSIQDCASGPVTYCRRRLTSLRRRRQVGSADGDLGPAPPAQVAGRPAARGTCSRRAVPRGGPRVARRPGHPARLEPPLPQHHTQVGDDGSLWGCVDVDERR